MNLVFLHPLLDFLRRLATQVKLLSINGAQLKLNVRFMDTGLSVVEVIGDSMLWVNTEGCSSLKLFLDPAFDFYTV